LEHGSINVSDLGSRRGQASLHRRQDLGSDDHCLAPQATLLSYAALNIWHIHFFDLYRQVTPRHHQSIERFREGGNGIFEIRSAEIPETLGQAPEDRFSREVVQAR